VCLEVHASIQCRFHGISKHGAGKKVILPNTPSRLRIHMSEAQLWIVWVSIPLSTNYTHCLQSELLSGKPILHSSLSGPPPVLSTDPSVRPLCLDYVRPNVGVMSPGWEGGRQSPVARGGQNEVRPQNESIPCQSNSSLGEWRRNRASTTVISGQALIC
jgi:hypothetical protein